MIFDPSGWGFWLSLKAFKQHFRWFGLLLLGLFVGTMLSSCAAKAPPPEREFIPEVIATPEVESRGSVYVYGQDRLTNSGRVILQLNGEPLLLPSGYARVVGVVSGGRPVACLEIGGRGLALGEGDKLDDYQVISISERSIILQKGK